MPEPTEHQQVATDILRAYVQAVIAAQPTDALVQGGLIELGLVLDVSSSDILELQRLIDTATVTITTSWEDS